MIDHFTQGPLTPAVAYTVSVIGSFVGLVFASRARMSVGTVRWAWLVLSATCIGGTAVWSMHFIAMMGFQVAGTAIRYDIALTVASGLLAIVVMGVALYLTITRRTPGSLMVGGAIAGSGVVAMHYMGMASINMHGHMGHDPLFVVMAAAIALVAATVALWFALRLQGPLPTLAASLVMGVAVTCMHYTGMFGVHVTVEESPSVPQLPGSTAPELLLPLVIGLFVFLMVCSLLLMLDVSDSGFRGGSSARDGDEDPVSSEEDDESYTARHRSADVWNPRR
ncbi:MHYT domain-containing protein [Nocardiopsis quinghaiensis]|uniref:MHYT domain-containing protein n=1 Tax=Nocardiopsis quinghaiensis TaxID=464995 RepID=UPI00123841B3|nr:MHYT domain-containing protein [Nocardiopsis quinghaiensis]